MSALPRSARRGSEPSAGFSLVELLTVMVVIGILAQIAVPNFKAVTLKARAVDVIADMEVVEQAASVYQADLNAWPAEAGPGAVPAGLGPYLPDGFSFTAGEGFTLDWESIAVPGGLPSEPGVTRLFGVGVVIEEPGLAEALVAALGENTLLIIGSTYIRVFASG